MKKTTFSLLAILFLISFSFGQTYTSGLIDVQNNLGTPNTVNSVQLDIDITNDIVTATIIGPDDSWLGFGFDTISMTEDKDIILFDGTSLVDRTFQGIGVTPELDENLGGNNSNWTLITNTTSAGLRTIVATRPRVAVDGIDYTFPSDQSDIDVVTAHGDNEFALNYHGFGNKGSDRLVFTTLSNDTFQISDFSLSPNPARDNISIVLPSTIKNSRIEIYDVLGKRIYTTSIENTHTKSIDVSNWKSGVYLIRVSNDKSTHTKRFVKQ